MTRPCPGGDRGSVLTLLPAGFLVLLILAAAAVDSAVVFLGQREALALSARAASDVIIAAADPEAFYAEGGVLRLDPGRVQESAVATVVEGESGALEVTSVEAVCDENGGLAVTVRVEGEVEVVFAPAVGGLHRWAVAGTTTMTAEEAGVHEGQCGP